MQDRTLDAWIREWAEDVVRLVHKSEYSNVNAVERILRDPGISTAQGQHRVLWWPRTRRIAKVSRAAHQLTVLERVTLIVDAGAVSDDKGGRLTPEAYSKLCKFKASRFGAYVKRIKRKLQSILHELEK